MVFSLQYGIGGQLAPEAETPTVAFTNQTRCCLAALAPVRRGCRPGQPADVGKNDMSLRSCSARDSLTTSNAIAADCLAHGAVIPDQAGWYSRIREMNPNPDSLVYGAIVIGPSPACSFDFKTHL
jgi:hypothetical protein